MTDKIILDATCGTRSIWFNKNHPAAVYMDKRIVVNEKIWESKDKSEKRYINIQPDVLGDFTEIPYESNHFSLVIFDPPHIRQAGETAWIVKKYGKLNENWPQMLHDGFKECMRVLKPEGVLIFKWSEVQIPAKEVWKALGCKPLFGHHSGKNSLTYWGVFMKGIDRMSRPPKEDKVCSIFRCPKLKNNVCCYNCKRYDSCEIRCLNAPHLCGMYIKPTRGGYEP